MQDNVLRQIMLETAGTQTIYYTMAIGVYHMLWRGFGDIPLGPLMHNIFD